MSLFQQAFSLCAVDAALNEHTSNSNEVECELVWYVQLKEFKDNGNTCIGIMGDPVSIEEQEQFEVELNSPYVNRAITRSRKTTRCDDKHEPIDLPTYEVTYKASVDDKLGQLEPKLPGSENTHELHKMLNPNGLHKMRYSYPCIVTVEDEDGKKDYETHWEVDVFLLKDGSCYPWIKVDLEIPKEIAGVVIESRKKEHDKVTLSKFPIVISEAFEATYGIISTEDRAKVNEILAYVRKK